MDGGLLQRGFEEFSQQGEAAEAVNAGRASDFVRPHILVLKFLRDWAGHRRED